MLTGNIIDLFTSMPVAFSKQCSFSSNKQFLSHKKWCGMTFTTITWEMPHCDIFIYLFHVVFIAR